MLKVGIPEAVDPQFHHLLPEGIALQVIPMQPEHEIEVEFWIMPPWPRQAERMWPWLRGVRVAQAPLAGVEGFLKFLPREVILCDARGAHNIATAEWVIAAILGSLKYFPLYRDICHPGDWSLRKEGEASYRALHGVTTPLYPPVLVEELHGKRVLIVGYGAIGQAIEERLAAFGVRIERVARRAREGVHSVAALPELLPEADIIILMVPGTSETVGMIGERELASLKPGTLLVNAARGSVINTDALVAALHSRRIRAALDVTEPEPLPAGHPLWSAPNLLLTPHVAASSPTFMRRAMECAAAEVRRYLSGEPLENAVTGEY